MDARATLDFWIGEMSRGEPGGAFGQLDLGFETGGGGQLAGVPAQNRGCQLDRGGE